MGVLGSISVAVAVDVDVDVDVAVAVAVAVADQKGEIEMGVLGSLSDPSDQKGGY